MLVCDLNDFVCWPTLYNSKAFFHQSYPALQVLRKTIRSGYMSWRVCCGWHGTVFWPLDRVRNFLLCLRRRRLCEGDCFSFGAQLNTPNLQRNLWINIKAEDSPLKNLAIFELSSFSLGKKFTEIDTESSRLAKKSREKRKMKRFKNAKQRKGKKNEIMKVRDDKEKAIEPRITATGGKRKKIHHCRFLV